MTQSAEAPRRPRKPRILTVVRDPAPDEVGRPIDWSDWYLTEEEDVRQGPEQDDVVDVFSSSLTQLVRQREPGAVRVGRDAFFAWLEHEPNVRVSPDVYLLDDPPSPPWPRIWELWRAGHAPPRFALEVVSTDWRKDYDEAPAKYAMLGAEELVIHDPVAARGAADPPRVALQLYRLEDDGSFVRHYAGAGPAFSEALGVWLVSAPDEGVGWLRLADDPQGERLIPTARERADQETQRADQETQRADQETQRADQETQRAERLAAQLRALGIEPEADPRA